MILRKLSSSFRESVEKTLSERSDPPPGPHPTKLIDELIKDFLAPVLKDKGFRKSGANFWHDNVNVIEVLNIQKSQWNDAWKASFYINLGAYWKAFHRDQHTEFKSKFPREYDCTVFSRVLEPSMKTWSLQPNSDLSEVGIILTKAVREVAFPWFEQMHSEMNILNHLQSQGIAGNFEAWLNSRA